MTYGEVYVPIMFRQRVRRSSWPIGCYTKLIPIIDPDPNNNRWCRTAYRVGVEGPLMLAAQCVVDQQATDWEVVG